MKYASSIIFGVLFLFSCSQEPEKIDKTNTSKETTQETENETEESQPINSDSTTIAVSNDADSAENAEVPEEFEDLDWLEYEESMTQDFSFVIILSTKSYNAALQRAKEASAKMGYPVDLRGLHENQESGLSFSRKVCEEDICGGGLDYPIYIPRSDWGDRKYVSIEYSDGFNGFTKGYYIVVVASGERGDPIVKEALTEAKQFYKDAYAKTCGVWMGCGC